MDAALTRIHTSNGTILHTLLIGTNATDVGADLDVDLETGQVVIVGYTYGVLDGLVSAGKAEAFLTWIDPRTMTRSKAVMLMSGSNWDIPYKVRVWQDRLIIVGYQITVLLPVQLIQQGSIEMMVLWRNGTRISASSFAQETYNFGVDLVEVYQEQVYLVGKGFFMQTVDGQVGNSQYQIILTRMGLDLSNRTSRLVGYTGTYLLSVSASMDRARGIIYVLTLGETTFGLTSFNSTLSTQTQDIWPRGAGTLRALTIDTGNRRGFVAGWNSVNSSIAKNQTVQAGSFVFELHQITDLDDKSDVPLLMTTLTAQQARRRLTSSEESHADEPQDPPGTGQAAGANISFLPWLLVSIFLFLTTLGAIVYMLLRKPRQKKYNAAAVVSQTPLQAEEHVDTEVVGHRQHQDTEQSQIIFRTDATDRTDRTDHTDRTDTEVAFGNTFMSNSSTILIADRELSIPAFSEVREGVDFVVESRRSVATGGASVLQRVFLKSFDLQHRAGTEFAIAKYVKGLDMNVPVEREVFQQEIAMLYYFNGNRHFCKLVGFCSTPPIILMKYYEYGTLKDWIENNQTTRAMTASMAKSLCRGIASALRDMHRAGFVHCDLKPANVLLDKDEQGYYFSVLADFGIARVISNNALKVSAFHTSRVIGASIPYASPEVVKCIMSDKDFIDELQGEPDLMKACDIYSFGMILYNILCGRIPYHEYTDMNDIAQMVINDERPSVEITLPGHSTNLKALSDLMQKCTNPDPKQRPKIGSIYGALAK